MRCLEAFSQQRIRRPTERELRDVPGNMRRPPPRSGSTVAARLQGPSRSVGLPSKTECPTVSSLLIQYYEIATQNSAPRSDVVCPEPDSSVYSCRSKYMSEHILMVGIFDGLALCFRPLAELRPLDTPCDAIELGRLASL